MLYYGSHSHEIPAMVNSKGNNQEATMKSMAWLRVVVVLVLLMGFAGGLLQWAMSRPDDDWRGLALNLVTEVAGAAMTYTLFELFIGRIEKHETESEAEKKEREARKADLIAQMGSNVKDVAIAAAEELQRHGWLYDGSLRGANLSRTNLQGAILFKANLQRAYLGIANLQGANLYRADLQGASLSGANLQEADLLQANLQRADLRGANLQRAYLNWVKLQGAYLVQANLQGAFLLQANLQGAEFDEDTILPDGTKWTPGTDMARFTHLDHPDFWRPDA
jgi:hypothetical protein